MESKQRYRVSLVLSVLQMVQQSKEEVHFRAHSLGRASRIRGNAGQYCTVSSHRCWNDSAIDGGLERQCKLWLLGWYIAPAVNQKKKELGFVMGSKESLSFGSGDKVEEQWGTQRWDFE